MGWQRGFLAVLVLIFIALYGLLRERSAVSVSPVLRVVDKASVPSYIALCGSSFSRGGQCVVLANPDKSAIISRANSAAAKAALVQYFAATTVSNAQALSVQKDSRGKLVVRCSYMPAAQQITLGIALHPDRMNEQDWQALPGVGAATAHTIVADRLRNGAFHSLAGVARVHGIGAKKLASWQQFF